MFSKLLGGRWGKRSFSQKERWYQRSFPINDQGTTWAFGFLMTSVSDSLRTPTFHTTGSMLVNMAPTQLQLLHAQLMASFSFLENPSPQTNLNPHLSYKLYYWNQIYFSVNMSSCPKLILVFLLLVCPSFLAPSSFHLFSVSASLSWPLSLSTSFFFDAGSHRAQAILELPLQLKITVNFGFSCLHPLRVGFTRTHYNPPPTTKFVPAGACWRADIEFSACWANSLPTSLIPKIKNLYLHLESISSFKYQELSKIDFKVRLCEKQTE